VCQVVRQAVCVRVGVEVWVGGGRVGMIGTLPATTTGEVGRVACGGEDLCV
jgi:hypothetical protein